jgi:hypothetical protein
MPFNTPHARISENRLVLSLPDAMTPVVWMMDLKDEGTFILRVEQNDAGLFILQKISRDGKKIEDIAYYTREKCANKAMRVMTSCVAQSGQKTPLKKIFSLIKILLFLAGMAAILLIVYVLYKDEILSLFSNNTAVVAPAVQQENIITDDRNAVGVPMSADDFFSGPESLLPF